MITAERGFRSSMPCRRLLRRGSVSSFARANLCKLRVSCASLLDATPSLRGSGWSIAVCRCRWYRGHHALRAERRWPPAWPGSALHAERTGTGPLREDDGGRTRLRSTERHSVARRGTVIWCWPFDDPYQALARSGVQAPRAPSLAREDPVDSVLEQTPIAAKNKAIAGSSPQSGNNVGPLLHDALSRVGRGPCCATRSRRSDL